MQLWKISVKLSRGKENCSNQFEIVIAYSYN